MNKAEKAILYPEKIVFCFERHGLLDWMREFSYLRLVYRLAFRRGLDLQNPKTITEKINWYKLNYRNPLMRQCADKYEVWEYVKKYAGEKYLNLKMISFSAFMEKPDFYLLYPNDAQII